MITALIIIGILIFLLIIFIIFTGNNKDDNFPNANKRTEQKESKNINVSTVAEKNSQRLFDKFKRKKYIRGNFLGVESLSPLYYGLNLLKRRNYSHKQTNKK